MRTLFNNIFLLIIIFNTLIYSQSNSGLASLKIGTGARELSLAEAVSSNNPTPFSVIYNPALLGNLSKYSIGLGHNSWFADVNNEFLSTNFFLFSLPLNINLISTSIGNIEVRTKPGDKETSISANYFSIGINTGFNISENISVGIGGKILYENIFSDDATGFAGDFGFLINNFYKELSFSGSVRNIGKMSALRNLSTKLPTDLRLALSYNRFNLFDEVFLLPSFEFQRYFPDEKNIISLGLEADYNNLIFMRFGYRINNDLIGFSTGVGINYSNFSLDYSFIPFMQSFGNANILSLSINL